MDTLFCNLFEIFKLVLVYMHPKNKENTDLCLQGQTVSDYHPLYLILGQYLLFKNLKKFFGCILGRSRSCIPKELPTEECPILVPSFGHRGPDEVMQSIY